MSTTLPSRLFTRAKSLRQISRFAVTKPPVHVCQIQIVRFNSVAAETPRPEPDIDERTMAPKAPKFELKTPKGTKDCE